jgi:hypothetical protein
MNKYEYFKAAIKIQLLYDINVYWALLKSLLLFNKHLHYIKGLNFIAAHTSIVINDK